MAALLFYINTCIYDIRYAKMCVTLCKKEKNTMAKLTSLILSVFFLFQSVPIAGRPTLKVDASKPVGEMTTKATGFLYGLDEKGVPSEAMTNSLKISSVSQKVPGGLQHPTGDAHSVSSQLENCDYIVVYIQDSFDTWYYCHQEIMQMRKNGTYDWREFLEKRYLPLVKEKVEFIQQQDYADRIVYCIFNECDNAIWFGNYVDGNVDYDEIGKKNFYEAWKIVYDYVKSLAPDAKIGGPGFFDYNTEKITDFLSFCKESSCVPEIMIYHELNPWSIPDWETHYEDYRRIEKELAIGERDIIVTEYGCMEDCGDPSLMLQYITSIEKTGTWANMAFWRLSNNLNDTCADDNSPNSNWWLYRKYAEMAGESRLETKVTALSDKQLYDKDWRLKYTGVASINEAKDEIKVICTGSKNARAVQFTGLNKTNLGSKVTVKVECVYYKGLSGIVSSPITVQQYTASPSLGKINVNINGTDTNAVYFVTVKPYSEGDKIIRNSNIPVRYEFEKGTLQGDAYTYDSAYATTGEQKGMVGGMEKDADGVKLTFSIPKDGTYNLDIIFGKHNDAWGNPQGRDYAKVKVIIDGKEQIISLENTIKSEYTTCKTLTAELSTGCHTIEFYNCEGTYVLDSMLVSRKEAPAPISVLEDSVDGSAFLAVAPEDGYYRIDTAGIDAEITVDGIKVQIENGDIIYLRRGLNEISFNKKNMSCSFMKTAEKAHSVTIGAEDISLSDGAELYTDKYGVKFIEGISNIGGKGKFTVNVPEAGAYRVTLTYANNAEGGVHDYNVDLIERYVTVSANGKSQDVFCRNTYSRYTYKTVTFTLDLAQGENEVILSNSGNTIFAGMTAFAPQISEISVNALTK